MLLGGEGPIHGPVTPDGKLFAGLYALYCGLVVLAAVGLADRAGDPPGDAYRALGRDVTHFTMDGSSMSDATMLKQQVALVTGASRGVGRGVSTALAAAGARVFATGRSIQQANLPPTVTALVCDHTDDAAVEGSRSAGSTRKRAGSTCWSTRPGAATSG